MTETNPDEKAPKAGEAAGSKPEPRDQLSVTALQRPVKDIAFAARFEQLRARIGDDFNLDLHNARRCHKTHSLGCHASGYYRRRGLRQNGDSGRKGNNADDHGDKQTAEDQT